MADNTENYWAKTEAKLLEMEANEDYDLFVLGYLIPHIGLGEANCPPETAPKTYLEALIRESIEADKGTFNEKDLATIEKVLAELIGS